MLSDEVYDQLLALLGSGTWLRDTRLPSEHELAKRFAVSRPILRQALARLRTEGRLYSRKGSGTYVREVVEPSRITFDPLGSIPEVRSFLEFRCSVESEMTARATRRADPDAIAEVGQARRRLEDALATGAPGVEEDVAFHMAIAQATGNRFFITTLAALSEQMIFSIRLTRELATHPAPERFAAVVREHARIHLAMEKGDAAEARAAMNDHLMGGIKWLFGN